MANRTERALKKQARLRMKRNRDDKNSLINKREGIYSPYNSLMKESERSAQIKELEKCIKEERKDKQSIYRRFIEVNENINSYAKKSKEEKGA